MKNKPALLSYALSASYSAFVALLVVALVYTSIPVPLAQASSRIDKAEVESALEVAQRYTEMVDHFEQILDGKPMDRHPLDSYSLLQQRAHPSETGGMRVVPWVNLDVTVTTFTEEPKALFSTNMRNTANFNSGTTASTFSCSQGGGHCRVVLSTDKHGTLNEFFIPMKSMTTFGSFIVFVRENSYDSGRGTQVISFVDLEQYASLIGNEDIPVNEVEVKMDRALTSLEVQKHSILLNGGEARLYDYQLQDLSKIFLSAYNVKANLVNPATYQGALAQVDNFAEYMDKMADITQREEAAETENTRRVMVDFARLKESLVGDLDLQQRREQPRIEMDATLQSEKTHGRAVIGNAANVLASEEAEPFLSEEQKTRVKEFVVKLEDNRKFDAAVAGSQEKYQASRATFASFKRTVIYFATPRPGASNSIKNAIAALMARIKVFGAEAHYKFYSSGGTSVGAAIQLTSAQLAYRATKLAEWFSGRKLATAGMMTYSLMAVAFPEVLAMTFETALSIGQGLFNYIKSAFTGTFSAVVEGAGPVMEVINPLRTLPVIDQAYIEGDKWTRTVIAVSGWLTVVAGILGTYHVTQNVVRLGLAMRQPGYRGFVRRMVKMVRDYKVSLAKAESERLRMVADKAADFEKRHPKEVQRLNRLAKEKIAEVEALKERMMKQSRIYQMTRPLVWLVKGTAATVSKLADVTFGSAFRRMLGSRSKLFLYSLRVWLFSFASYTRTALDYAQTWNFWSGLRYSTFSFARVRIGRHRVPFFITVKPIGLTVRLLYPRFFSRVVATQVGQATLPTELNGGTHNIARVLGRYLNLYLNHLFLGSSVESQKAKLRAIRQFESEVTDLESRLASRVIKKATRQLVHFLSQEKQLREIFEGQGINNVTSNAFTYLNYANKSFINAYFDSVFDAAMQEVLREAVAGSHQGAISRAVVGEMRQNLPNNPAFVDRFTQAIEEADRLGSIREATLTELKNIVVSVNQQAAEGAILDASERIPLDLSDAELDRIAERVSSSESHLQRAQAQAKLGYLSAKNWVTNSKHGFTSYLDPSQTASLQRYAIVQKKKDDAQSMSRAVRQETVEMFTTLPVDLGFKLALTAGITEGPLKPLQTEFMGENSIMHFSQMSMYNGMATGIALGMLSNAWFKLQEDHFNDAAGNFGMVPKGQDAERSFLRWWLKMYLDKEKNSTMINYKRHWQIVGPNIPAAVPNIAVMQLNPLFGLGRLDLSLILISYSLSALPIGAWFMKIEQAFELAANYDAKFFPEELWDHPEVQSYLQKQAALRRVKFNLARDILLNPVGEAIGNIEVTPTSTHGTRGWLRSVLPGNILPEEAVINGSRQLAESTANIPGVNSLTDGLRKTCENLLNSSYSEWTKVK